MSVEATHGHGGIINKNCPFLARLVDQKVLRKLWVRNVVKFLHDLRLIPSGDEAWALIKIQTRLSSRDR